MRQSKGTNGYINDKKVRQSLYIICIVLIAGALFGIGYVTTHTSKNLLTVVAVLSVLPGAKALIQLFLFLPYRSFDRTTYAELAEAAGEHSKVYGDLVFTSTETSMHLDFLCIYGTECIGYVEKSSKKNEKIVQYFTDTMKKQGISVHIHVFTSLSDVRKRLSSLPKEEREIPVELTDFIKTILV